jgi:hypothetical protein
MCTDHQDKSQGSPTYVYIGMYIYIYIYIYMYTSDATYVGGINTYIYIPTPVYMSM